MKSEISLELEAIKKEAEQISVELKKIAESEEE
jgi:hypothetical protein